MMLKILLYLHLHGMDDDNLLYKQQWKLTGIMVLSIFY